MRFKFLPFILLLGDVNSLPTGTAEHELEKRVDVPKLMKNAWLTVGQAYQRFDMAVQGIRPIPGGAGANGVPEAHYNLMNAMTSTLNSIYGLKPLLYAETSFDLPLSALALRDTEVAALNTVLRAKPIVVRTGERVAFYQALIEQSKLHARWSNAFKAMVPTLPQGSGGMSNQVLDMYNKAISLYSTD